MEFIVTTIIEAPVSAIYNGWLNSEIHSKMTGGEAEICNEVNKPFEAWDGYISGTNLELIEDKFIKQSWRTVEFESNQQDSIIEITFELITSNSTQITIFHRNLLESDIQYKNGWMEHYLEPMKAYFMKK